MLFVGRPRLLLACEGRLCLFRIFSGVNDTVCRVVLVVYAGIVGIADGVNTLLLGRKGTSVASHVKLRKRGNHKGNLNKNRKTKNYRFTHTFLYNYSPGYCGYE